MKISSYRFHNLNEKVISYLLSRVDLVKDPQHDFYTIKINDIRYSLFQDYRGRWSIFRTDNWTYCGNEDTIIKYLLEKLGYS
jgi:hypothetical protein